MYEAKNLRNYIFIDFRSFHFIKVSLVPSVHIDTEIIDLLDCFNTFLALNSLINF